MADDNDMDDTDAARQRVFMEQAMRIKAMNDAAAQRAATPPGDAQRLASIQEMLRQLAMQQGGADAGAQPQFVDRIEGDQAVTLSPDAGTMNVPMSQMRGAKEGTMMRGGKPDEAATKAALEEIRRKSAMINWRKD